jgi:flagellar hook-associated protein 1 FlgK
MAGLSDVLEIARRSINAQRAAIDTSGHNIANASTPGYSRQRVDFAPTVPSQQMYGLLGTGVEAIHVGRIRERFIDSQIRASNSYLGQADAQQQILSQIEAAVNEPSDSGLSSMISKFFDTFKNFAVHPEDTAYRTTLIQQSTLMTDTFHQLYSNIEQAQQDLSTEVEGQVTQINKLTKEISSLDLQIVKSTSAGYDPSDLKDQRDLKLDELSKLVPISVTEDPSGSQLVSIGGTVVSSRSGSTEVKTLTTGNQLSLASADSGRVLNVQSGKMGGMLDTYNKTLPQLLDRMDSLASNMINQVNSIHTTGYGMGTPPPTGTDFFSGTSAANISINAAIVNSPGLLAASQDGSVGDNRNALAIADLKNKLVMNDSTTSMLQYFNDFASDIGTTLNEAKSAQATQELVYNQLKTQRDSVSSVSIDEEMSNMIKYQRAFDASAKLVSIVDELFTSIINMKQL